ncbi:hypothetical protein [Enterobacteria phage vB_EcoM_IME281]|uniref:Nuclease associated modular domain-containing protein n=1 Tax=Enterobacteria phage vB_EcoM_IME281 TaxID=2163887 RepID=A0A2S1GPF2_9CAUD|nr:HNH endonuclease [Enterobacteria phage vB_EcoM_IME281]AWD91284.1 hypothetical protein [Enterobacteria phage vB_EcoM_IME281]QAY00032.1 hypothetical protein EcWhh1_99 [Escherichia phage EcWhh-1]
MFIVYLTIYSGDKLPPFYIGSTSLEKHLNGYHGSVKSKKYQEIYKSELAAHPELFDSLIVEEFETREEATKAEYKYQVLNNAAKSDLFFNRATAAPKGFFGSDVSKENNPFFNKHHSHETIKIQSGLKLGELNPMYGIKRPEHSKAMAKENNPFFGKKHTDEALIKCGLKNRKSPVWEYESALEDLWLELDKPKLAKFMKESIKRGFPEGSYKNILKQFERKHND